MAFKHFDRYIPIPDTVPLDFNLPPSITTFISNMQPALTKLIAASPINPEQPTGPLVHDIHDYLGIYTPSNAKPQPRWATYNRPGYRGPLKPFPVFILSLATYALLPFYPNPVDLDLDQSQTGGLLQQKPTTYHMPELILHL